MRTSSLPTTYGSQQLAAWSLRIVKDDLLGYFLLADPHLFALFYASCAAAVPPPEALVPDRSSDGAPVSDKLLETLKDLQRQYGEEATGQFARLYLDGVSVYGDFSTNPDRFRELAEDWQEEAERSANEVITTLDRNIDRLSELLELDETEKQLLTFQFIRHAVGFHQLFSTLLRYEELALTLIGLVIDKSRTAVRAALNEESKLVRSGLVSVQQRPLKIDLPSTTMRSTLVEAADSATSFFERFVKPLKPSPSTASLARFDERDLKILEPLLTQKQPDGEGLHVLVYGPSSIDKSDLLARTLADIHLPGYAVQIKDVPPHDLPAWVFIAQNWIDANDPHGVLVVDRAEQALASRRISMMSFFGMVEENDPSDDGRASDAGLTASTARCIWLAEHGGFLTERNLARFLFHCEAKPGSRADRRERIQQVVAEFDLSPTLERELAKYSLLGEHQVRQAAKLATRISEQPDERDQIIRRAVLQSQRVLGREQTEDLMDSVTHYSLANLNLDGRFTADQILTALRHRPRGSILLYGIPGAGKTALAEFAAVELDMPLLKRRASDILSKWLGDSEKNIARMFQDAEEEGAILFLDECDSFLRDRALAKAEWNVTQVNELLQQMERFSANNIFIAATNLFRDIDAAAMRRFTWKLQFMPLTADQSWSMFCVESGFDADAPENAAAAEELRERLEQIENLAPGDFATVKRQANMLGEELDVEGWLDQLAVEAKAKMHGLVRNKMGF